MRKKGRNKYDSSIVCLSWEHLSFSDGRSNFSHLVVQEGLEDKIQIDSAGTGDWHIGHRPHEGTQKILKENEVSLKELKHVK